MEKLENFKCPNCGGILHFDTKSQKLKCESCEGEFDPTSFDKDKGLKIENQTWDEDKQHLTFTCKMCGGSLYAHKDVVSLSCPYCGNQMVLEDNVSNEYKPNRIIPFKLDKNKAKEEYRKHLSKKVFLPEAFKDDAIIDEIKGIYVPYWIFGGDVVGKAWYDATRINTWSDGSYNYTETSYYKLFRSCRVSFSNIPVDASSKIADDLTQSIEPFDLKDITEFNTNYLAGYCADKYDVDEKESEVTANSRIQNTTQNLLNNSTIGFVSCIPSMSNINISSGSQEYVMYPLWLLNVKYDGKDYQFAMNGQTGKFVGNLPKDGVKVTKILLSTFFGVAALLTLIQFIITLFI